MTATRPRYSPPCARPQRVFDRKFHPGGKPCWGIGVSATGQIDSRKGIVAGTCGNFPNYINSPIQAELEKDFGLPVTVANDANCMTLGEVWVGGAKGYTDVIGVTLGTGVGGGILTGGRLLEGARGLGGELGHYRTHALDGIPCTCGATGCWERYAATTALVRAAQEKNPDWKDGRAIFAAAEAGDETVLALLDAWTDEIAQGLAGMVHIFNPQLILIGGGVSAQQKLLIDPIAAKVKASVMPAFAEGLEVRAAQLHNDAGMVGAVYYFRPRRPWKRSNIYEKTHILCLGDSNTHGYCADPNDSADVGIRFNEEERWTCRLQTALGEKYLVTEEGLSGRTTVFVDPIHESMDALSVIYAPLLKSHEVIDLLIIMLGTNDVKERFGANAACIAAGMERLILKAKRAWTAGAPSSPTFWWWLPLPSAQASTTP